MAGFISHQTIDLIHSTVDLKDVVGEYTKLERRSGNDWWGCCPFHGEKTASFHVNTDQKFYYCFGCHASGDVVKFIMEMEKLSYPEAVTSLAKRSGIPIQYEDGAPPADYKKDDTVDRLIELYDRVATSFQYMLLETEQGKKALDYVMKRGLTMETIKKFRLGYSPANPHWLKGFLRSKNFSDDFLAKSGLFSAKYPDYAFFSDRLMFPIFNRKGQVVAFGGRVLPPASEKERKYLNSGDLPQFKKRETLFGFNFAKNSIRMNKRIIFCEGNMDVIAYHQCGLDYAVATLGTAFTEEHIKMIQGFVADGTVFLSFDSDEAGQNATKKACYLCRRNNLTVKIIQLKGGKDPAEIMLKFGKENLTAQVNSAILDSDYFLNKLGEKYPLDKPEGKTKASLEFFDYIDSLQSDIQKESCLEQLSQAFNLKPEAVKRDFLNRNEAQKRIETRSGSNQTENATNIKLNAELRGLIAVVQNSEQFKRLRSCVSSEDFQDPEARRLYTVLEECFVKGTYSIPDILTGCNNPALEQLITRDISAGVYQSDTVGIVVDDTIKFIKKNRIDAQRENLLKRIREYTVITKEDKIQLDNLLMQKLELDKQAQSLLK